MVDDMKQMVVQVSINGEQFMLEELFPKGECEDLPVVKWNVHVDI
jgi:hypothetical protein